ncbi:FAD binding domain-containing protein [Cladophialophora immunda]|nr:FAD binding domain-containing protein [Cladophialophora immunda]
MKNEKHDHEFQSFEELSDSRIKAERRTTIIGSTTIYKAECPAPHFEPAIASQSFQPPKGHDLLQRALSAIPIEALEPADEPDEVTAIALSGSGTQHEQWACDIPPWTATSKYSPTSPDLELHLSPSEFPAIQPIQKPHERMELTREQQYTARAEITAVMHRYASLAREHADWDAMARLFGPDALYRLPNGVAVDPKRMVEVVRGNEAPYIRHHVTTVDIVFVGEGEARSEAFYLAVTDRASPDHWGMWRDVFRWHEREQVWLIQDRTIVVEGAAAGGWYATVYGLFLALRLARAGIRTVVFEQDAELLPTPRALGYFGPTQFALQHAGIWEEVRDQGYLLKGLSWRRTTQETSPESRGWGELIASWDLTKGSSSKEGECGYGMTILGQDRLRGIIMSELTALGLAQIRFGHKVIAVSQEDQSASVNVTVLDQQGVQRSFRGSYLVAADGGKSTVRKLLGLPLEGITWPQVLVATDTWANIPLPSDGPPFVYIVDPVDWALFSPIQTPCERGPSYYRITVPMAPEQCEPDVLDSNLKQKLERLLPGPRPAKYEVMRSQRYETHQRIVPSMLSGRCMLIGDAAHLNNPWGGLGLSTGLLDADSLADALTYVLAQGVSTSILQRWADARREVFQKLVNPISSANKLRCHNTDPDNPSSDPFFAMLRKENNEPELQALMAAMSEMATDVSQFMEVQTRGPGNQPHEM